MDPLFEEDGEILIHLDRMMLERDVSLKKLSEEVGISNVNLSRLKTGKVNGLKFSTLAKICKVLHCQPGDLLEYVEADAKVTKESKEGESL